MDNSLRLLGRMVGGSTQQSLQDWKTGQMLRALIISGTPAGTGGGRAVLRIGGSEYTVRSQTPLHAGESVQLRVTRSGPETRLQIIETASSATRRTTPSLTRTPLLAVVKSLLSQQIALGRGLQILASKPTSPDAETQRMLNQLVQDRPTLETLGQAQTLREAIDRSGSFLEAKIRGGLKLSPVDFKLQLAKTLGGINNETPSGIRSALEAITARITLNQLHSTSAAQSAAQNHWLIEIPFKTQAGFQTLRLEVEADRNDREETGDASGYWSVRLGLDLPRLGPIEARIRNIKGSVSAHFWAERRTTFAMIQSSLPELEAAWRDRGVQPGVLEAFHGHAPEAATPSDGPGGRLVDRQV
ncbi:flagellar hook-length control protein FliK [Acidihalobacter ferrooxydans]|uniref:Flagellar hook-length control protein-like C-terminal domain-containing protein n=1 Tax=Acidihalobacter ferrooxydans TaxID=1765967 RepID=A0A1P8UGX7_9GAMM|nr:flagellar hook-length control protein FliK [Acidihalobacter ferrooxydans]APZ43031.1 hypothetical protein BW247_07935 [Acidihalobacter ferrooxydans]